MRIVRLVNSAPMHVAILNCAAMLVPRHLRPEWQAEWRAELWHAWQGNGDRNVTMQCLGAFRDALWLRRDGPLGSRAHNMLHLDLPAQPVIYDFPHPLRAYAVLHVESSRQCLAFLGILAALSLLVSVLLPGFPFHGGIRAFVLFAAAAAGSAAVVRRPSWTFLAAKFVLLFAVLMFGTRDLVGILPASLWFFPIMWLWLYAIRWVVDDQRRRCPTCLRLLSNPVRIGGSSRILLEWHGTELICLRGHGLLHVPERPAIWFTRQRWVGLDASWRGLFRSV